MILIMYILVTYDVDTTSKEGLAVYNVWPRHVWIMDRGCRTQSLSV